MTQKDYVAIGDALRQTAATTTANDEYGRQLIQTVLNRVAENVATVFAADNAKFSRYRFLHYVRTGENRR